MLLVWLVLSISDCQHRHFSYPLRRRLPCWSGRTCLLRYRGRIFTSTQEPFWTDVLPVTTNDCTFHQHITGHFGDEVRIKSASDKTTNRQSGRKHWVGRWTSSDQSAACPASPQTTIYIHHHTQHMSVSVKQCQSTEGRSHRYIYIYRKKIRLFQDLQQWLFPPIFQGPI